MKGDFFLFFFVPVSCSGGKFNHRRIVAWLGSSLELVHSNKENPKPFPFELKQSTNVSFNRTNVFTIGLKQASILIGAETATH